MLPVYRTDKWLMERLSALLTVVDPVPPTVEQSALDLFEQYAESHSDRREQIDARCRELGESL